MTIELSIVLAVQREEDRLKTVLQALATQVEPHAGRVEVLVCHDGLNAEAEALCQSFSWARAVVGSDGALIPHLWRDGIDAAQGARVALTVVHCMPGAGWVERLLEANLTDYVGVGGALENAGDSSSLDWAIHLLRYMRYTPPFGRRETHDVAGDNVVYDRVALRSCHGAYRHGFWEPEIHALWSQEGKKLLLDPELVSIHKNAYDLASFARQRFLHATQFGRDRAEKMSPARRLLQLLGSPAVPVVFGSKVLRGALSNPEFRRRLPGALPYLFVLLNAWAAGEFSGTLKALRTS